MKRAAAILLMAVLVAGVAYAISETVDAVSTLHRVRASLVGYCAVHASFEPKPDITVPELAYICSHSGCVKRVCFREEQFAALPENIRRHFVP